MSNSLNRTITVIDDGYQVSITEKERDTLLAEEYIYHCYDCDELYPEDAPQYHIAIPDVTFTISSLEDRLEKMRGK